MDFQEAKSKYVHRYTMEHVPNWAKRQAPNGKYYAPQYTTDKEWFDNTQFYDPAIPDCKQLAEKNSCYSSGQSWPLGHWLSIPLNKE